MAVSLVATVSSQPAVLIIAFLLGSFHVPHPKICILELVLMFVRVFCLEYLEFILSSHLAMVLRFHGLTLPPKAQKA
eukprot:m.239198 g.239198  ORF g.239198 m.239198 type:complete len:77 (-) comp26574_c1_seq1:874-1104(-)